MDRVDESEGSKVIALKAIRGVFIERDARVVQELFAPDYIQHNPTIPSGRDAIGALVGSLPEGFRYAPGMAVAEGSIVMIHGRYVGWAPEPMVAVDIFRVENGRLVEHWDVDHLDVRSLRALVDRQRTAPPMILAGLGVGPLLKSAGFSSYSELDWGESAKVKDARVHCLEAVHTSRRSIGDTDKTLWGSFLIDTPEGKIYFAGDSAYGTHFRTIYERFGATRISLLPI